jgi:hypothetical protein
VRFFKTKDERAYDKAYARLSKTLESRPAVVLQWAETSLWSIQEGLDGYRRSSDPAALQQARTGLIGLLAAVDVLLDRTG